MKLLTFKKLNDRVIPADEATSKLFNSLDINEEFSFEYKPLKQRNYKFHRKYYALLNAVVKNQEHYKTVDNLHESIKFKSGLYETIIPLEGHPFIKTKSISFASMSSSDFEDFWNIALDECIKLVSEESVNQIIRFM